MSNKFYIVFLIIFSCLLVNCSGDKSNNKVNEVDSTSAEREIMNVVDSTWAALENQDLEAFNKYVTPDWQLFTERAERTNAKSLLKTHRDNLTNFHVEYWNTDVNIIDSVAWVTMDATMTGQWQGKEWGGGRALFTIILFRNDDGEWVSPLMHESEERETRPGTTIPE